MKIVPFTKAFDRSSFDCGNEQLDFYLKRTLSQDRKRSLAASFLLVDEENVVLGYYTLSSHSLTFAKIPELVAKGLPSYPQIPTTLLGRLAVDKRLQGQGWGKRIVIDALKRAWDNRDTIGSWAVTVEAIDDPAEEFYEKLGFVKYDEKELFYTMKDIGKLW